MLEEQCIIISAHPGNSLVFYDYDRPPTNSQNNRLSDRRQQSWIVAIWRQMFSESSAEIRHMHGIWRV